MSCIDDFWKAKHAELLRLAQAHVGEEAGDLIGDLAVWSYNNPKGAELCKRGELAYYFVRAIRISGFSATSPHHRKYRQPTRQLPEHLTTTEDETSQITDQQLQWIHAELGQIRWFDARLFELYHTTDHTYASLSKATGIAKTTIHKSIQRTTAHLKEAARTWRHDS